MPKYTWVSYGGDARIWLAIGLLAVAGGVTFAGFRLPLPVGLTRPGRAGRVALILAWAVSIPAFLTGVTIYIRQFIHVPLFLVEITTLLLLRLSPMVRLTRATFFCYALMLGVFAVWALSGFGYPSAPLPTTLNIVSKILAFVTALTLFLPHRPQPEQAPGPGTSEQAHPVTLS